MVLVLLSFLPPFFFQGGKDLWGVEKVLSGNSPQDGGLLTQEKVKKYYFQQTKFFSLFYCRFTFQLTFSINFMKLSDENHYLIFTYYHDLF